MGRVRSSRRLRMPFASVNLAGWRGGIPDVGVADERDGAGGGVPCAEVTGWPRLAYYRVEGDGSAGPAARVAGERGPCPCPLAGAADRPGRAAVRGDHLPGPLVLVGEGLRELPARLGRAQRYLAGHQGAAAVALRFPGQVGQGAGP